MFYFPGKIFHDYYDVHVYIILTSRAYSLPKLHNWLKTFTLQPFYFEVPIQTVISYWIYAQPIR